MLPDDIKAQMPDGAKMTFKTVEDSSLNFYTNNATFSFSQWDICINMNEVIGSKIEDDSMITLVSRKARVVMNVSYAKQFAQVLLKHVAKHEEIERQQIENEAKAIPQSSTESILPEEKKSESPSVSI